MVARLDDRRADLLLGSPVYVVDLLTVIGGRQDQRRLSMGEVLKDLRLGGAVDRVDAGPHGRCRRQDAEPPTRHTSDAPGRGGVPRRYVNGTSAVLGDGVTYAADGRGYVAVVQ